LFDSFGSCLILRGIIENYRLIESENAMPWCSLQACVQNINCASNSNAWKLCTSWHSVLERPDVPPSTPLFLHCIRMRNTQNIYRALLNRNGIWDRITRTKQMLHFLNNMKRICFLTSFLQIHTFLRECYWYKLLARQVCVCVCVCVKFLLSSTNEKELVL
jgi:hypothetical protein